MEDSESRDKICRSRIDHFLNNSAFGKAIDFSVALLSLISSLAFIVLTYYDLRHLSPCCARVFEEHRVLVAQTEEAISNCQGDEECIENVGEAVEKEAYVAEHGFCTDGDPPCFQYYHNNRMPAVFELVDAPVCYIYAIHYFLNLFIAVNRCQFFIERYNLIQLFLVIVPPIVLPWHSTSQLSLLLLALSRLLRLEKATQLMAIFVDTGASEVYAQVYQIAMGLVITIYVAAGVFMVLENFDEDGELEYFTAFYATIVTITTVGYGDITPSTQPGQVFFAGLVPYVVFYLLAIQLIELTRLLSLKTPYQRAVYKQNPEISHIVISGEI